MNETAICFLSMYMVLLRLLTHCTIQSFNGSSHSTEKQHESHKYSITIMAFHDMTNFVNDKTTTYIIGATFSGKGTLWWMWIEIRDSCLKES